MTFPRIVNAAVGIGAIFGAVLLGEGAHGLPQAPSPELLTAHRWLERLAAAAKIDRPITLMVRTGPAAPCPAAFSGASGGGLSSLSSGPSLACLRNRSLSSPMGGGFFVPFVVALQQQSDPFAADPPAALALADRTILLHVPPTPLGLQPQAAPAGAEPDMTACLLARELAALRLDQPQQRAQAFEAIHSGLAATITSSSKAAHTIQSNKEFGLFLFSPLQMMISKATTPDRANPLNQELQESPLWVVLNGRAPAVAEALGSFGNLPEEALKKAWPSLDGAFAMAAQDRLELVEKQQGAALNESLPLLAEAGLDPRPCTVLGLAAVDRSRLAAAMATFERTKGNPAVAQRTLPRRFLPQTNGVVIFPAGTMAGAKPASR
ncbi:MAG: hypothetical protein VKP70_01300 [Cyanobacteriota bacterium]|nr:hypothetical protein [Cyanobacteriota bacterium]